MMSLESEGRVAVYSSSSKQKINTKKSTETELVRESNALPQVLWTQYLIENWGYNIKDNEFNQVNVLFKLHRSKNLKDFYNT